MKTIEANYSVTVSDFRKATYYGLFLRYRRPLQIMFLVLGTSILYYLASAAGFGEPNKLVFLLAGAYLVWGLILFAGAERSLKAYIKQPAHLLNCEYHVAFESHRVRFAIPARSINAAYALNKLAAVFELNALFLLYVNTQEVYILPKSALTEEQVSALRALFREQVRERFSTRFGKKTSNN